MTDEGAQLIAHALWYIGTMILLSEMLKILMSRFK